MCAASKKSRNWNDDMVEIIPSILVKTEEEFLEQSRAVADVLNMIQLDIADGVFVPNTTWADPDVVAEHLTLDCELHLMVQDPVEEVRKWADVVQVKRVFVHYESRTDDIADVLAQIHSYGWDVGVVLNPGTPIDVLDSFLEEVDAVMFMGVNPGFQGQTLIPEVLENMKAFCAAHPHLFVSIDGSVNEETLPDILATGVCAVCPGSAIFGNDEPPKKNIERMKALIHRLTEARGR